MPAHTLVREDVNLSQFCELVQGEDRRLLRHVGAQADLTERSMYLTVLICQRCQGVQHALLPRRLDLAGANCGLDGEVQHVPSLQPNTGTRRENAVKTE